MTDYWIVKPAQAETEVYRVPIDGTYTEVSVLDRDAPISPAAFPDFAFRLADYLPEAEASS